MTNAAYVREVGLAEAIALVKNSESRAQPGILDMINAWSGPFRVHDGDITHSGTFDVDTRPTIVWGNLKIDGALRDGREGGQTMLVVLGDLSAKDIVARSAIGVAGNLDVSGTFFAAIPDATRSSWESVTVGGKTKTHTLINAGHWVHLLGTVEAEVVFGHFEDIEHSGYEASELFESDYLDFKTGGLAELNLSKIASALIDGKAVVKENPTTRRRALFAALGDLDERSSITLEDAGISEIPEEVFTAKNLKKLVLDFNEIYTLPARIGQLHALRDLSLDDAPLRSLPDELGDLTNLEVLSLRFVKLRRLPSTFSNLKAMRELYLTYSALEAFPAELLELPRLEKLSFWHCLSVPDKLEAFIASMARIPTLKVLAFTQGDLRAMPDNISLLDHLEELQIIDQRLTAEVFDALRAQLPHVRVKTSA